MQVDTVLLSVLLFGPVLLLSVLFSATRWALSHYTLFFPILHY